MKRVIFDTSVYGKLVEDDIIRGNFEKKFERGEYVVYGNSVIRKELRDTPKSIIFNDKKLRLLLLVLYDSFVKKKNHDLNMNPLIEKLSKDYFLQYKRQKGSSSKEEMKNDFIIIATATIYQLDVIVSNDEKTMLSQICLAVYKTVNHRYGLKNPVFKLYSTFKKELM